MMTMAAFIVGDLEPRMAQVQWVVLLPQEWRLKQPPQQREHRRGRRAELQRVRAATAGAATAARGGRRRVLLAEGAGGVGAAEEEVAGERVGRERRCGTDFAAGSLEKNACI